MKALRIFYNEVGNILNNCGLEGPGIFPYSIEAQLQDYPEGTQCLEITETEIIDLFLHSNGSHIESGALILGTPLPTPLPKSILIRDLASELDALKAEIEALKADR